MNKISAVALALALSCPAFAKSPWGVLDTVEEHNDSSTQLIYKIAYNKPITYCIDNFSQEKTPVLSAEVSRAFTDWTQGSVSLINESGRGVEFKDISEILSKPVKLQEVPCGKIKGDDNDFSDAFLAVNRKRKQRDTADVHFVFSDTKAQTLNDGSVEYGWYAAAQKDSRGQYSAQVIFITSHKDRYVTLLHEIGHAIGLSDQYLDGRYNSNPRYGTSQERASVMNDENQITCDDADGIINLLDCIVFDKERGGKDGWRTLCKDDETVYKKCSAQDRGDFINLAPDLSSVRISSYDKDGKLTQTREYENAGGMKFYDVMSPGHSFITTKRDKKGRTTYLKDSDGYETYIDYQTEGLRAFSVFKDFAGEEKFLIGNALINASINPDSIYVETDTKSSTDFSQNVKLFKSKKDSSFLYSRDVKYYEKRNNKITTENYVMIIRLSTGSFFIKYIYPNYKAYSLAKVLADGELGTTICRLAGGAQKAIVCRSAVVAKDGDVTFLPKEQFDDSLIRYSSSDSKENMENLNAYKIFYGRDNDGDRDWFADQYELLGGATAYAEGYEKNYSFIVHGNPTVKKMQLKELMNASKPEEYHPKAFKK